MLREKCNFCHLQKCIVFCRVFVIFLSLCGNLSFFFVLVQVSQNSEKDRKILRKMTDKTEMTKKNDKKMTKKMTDETEMTKKRQKMTNKMTDQTEMTKK